jgi:uncharacterized protein YndB with AHSA1/START domain
MDQQQSFRLERLFDAPRPRVWRAFTEADQLKHWWGPKGFAMLSCKLDLRPGGLFHYGMRSPDGHEMWGKWVFRDIAAPELLSFVVSFSDAAGGITRHPMAPTWPLEMLSTTRFIAQGDKTLLSMETIAVNASDAERQTFVAGRDGMRQGFGGTLDQLDAYLAAQSSSAA